MSEIVLNDHVDSYYQLAKKMISEGLSHNDVLHQIKSQGVHDEIIFGLEKKLNIHRKIKLGFTLLIIGAFLCLSSCLISLGLNFSHPFCHYALYGLTSIGAGIALYALFLILG